MGGQSKGQRDFPATPAGSQRGLQTRPAVLTADLLGPLLCHCYLAGCLCLLAPLGLSPVAPNNNPGANLLPFSCSVPQGTAVSLHPLTNWETQERGYTERVGTGYILEVPASNFLPTFRGQTSI